MRQSSWYCSMYSIRETAEKCWCEIICICLSIDSEKVFMKQKRDMLVKVCVCVSIDSETLGGNLWLWFEALRLAWYTIHPLDTTQNRIRKYTFWPLLKWNYLLYLYYLTRDISWTYHSFFRYSSKWIIILDISGIIQVGLQLKLAVRIHHASVMPPPPTPTPPPSSSFRRRCMRGGVVLSQGLTRLTAPTRNLHLWKYLFISNSLHSFRVIW